MSVSDSLALYVKSLLLGMSKVGASDLHLITNNFAKFRIDGSLKNAGDRIVCEGDLSELSQWLLDDEQHHTLRKNGEIDFAFEYEGVRFRANLYFANSNLAAAFRIIGLQIPSFDELLLPSVIRDFLDLQSGLILVCGTSGSGKSTSIAAMLNEINARRSAHIITLEDPIEFIHKPIKSIFSQREIGSDTKKFHFALKAALRQDPDVLLLGELRDQNSIQTAISAAATGHLVFATLHTNSAISSIDRIIDSFEPFKQSQIRSMLASSLTAIISQNLIPKEQGGRVAIFEVLVNNQAISNLIRDDKIHQIYSQMQIGASQSGMITQTQAILKAFKDGIISKESALKYANEKIELLNLIDERR